MNHLKFYRLTLAELDQVVELENSAFPDPWSRGMLADALAQPNVYGVGVSKGSGVLIGYGLILLSKIEADLMTIGVSPNCQRQGVGAQVLNHLESHCLENGIEDIFLDVRVSNPALNFYLKQGYHKVGVRPGYYQVPLEDAVVMQKQLHA